MKMNKPDEVMKEKGLYGKYQIINTETGKEVTGRIPCMKAQN